MFHYILGLSALLLASCAAFFSVKGIALLFVASFWSVAIMAGSLEIAKLVCASYLYRYWNNINKVLRNYMLIATLLLMCITSLGIFGFLSDAFQKNFSQYNLNLNKITSLKNEKDFILSQIDFNNKKLKDLIELQKTYQSSLDSAVKQDVTTTKTTSGGLFSSNKTEKVTDQKLLDSKNKIVETSQQNINSLFVQISIVTSDLQSQEKQGRQLSEEILKLEADNTKGEIGTFKFVAEAFNMKIENAVRLFIILIVIVFDPLAVALIVAYNNIITKKNNFSSNIISSANQNAQETQSALDSWTLKNNFHYKNLKRLLDKIKAKKAVENKDPNFKINNNIDNLIAKVYSNFRDKNV